MGFPVTAFREMLSWTSDVSSVKIPFVSFLLPFSLSIERLPPEAMMSRKISTRCRALSEKSEGKGRETVQWQLHQLDELF